MSSAQKNNPPRQRLDTELVARKLVASRSQAESYIKLGRVKINRQAAAKPGQPVGPGDKLSILGQQYVSRAAFKLMAASAKLNIDFKNKVVLDAGSSTGGFTQYALEHGASKVIAVDVGTNQLHPALKDDKRIVLHEKTDIRDFKTKDNIDLVLVDVSFISLRQVLPAISRLIYSGSRVNSRVNSRIMAMVKPQFESSDNRKHKGVVKNDKLRRKILKDFEQWAKKYFVIAGKADSEVAGSKGNLERFYLLKLPKV